MGARAELLAMIIETSGAGQVIQVAVDLDLMLAALPDPTKHGNPEV